MDIYIDSFEAITPQNTFNSSDFLSETVELHGNYFTCITPKYADYLDPKALRRMSKIVRMGVASAKLAMQKADNENPDAIIVGTGLGCIEDTVKFLAQLIENNEQLLNPTAFIQSTHNTVSGQIALMLGCRNYNFTYTQKSISFESALIDAYCMLKGNESQNILVGGIDEVTEASYNLLSMANCAKNPNQILQNNSKGFIAGEGSVFFMLSSIKSNKNIAKISDISITNTIKNNDDLQNAIATFLNKNSLSISDIDVVITGANGDENNDKSHTKVQSIFEDSIHVGYKHVIGEYDTASAFGLYIASNIITKQIIPKSIRLNVIEKEKISYILIYNSFNNQNHTFTIVCAC